MQIKRFFLLGVGVPFVLIAGLIAYTLIAKPATPEAPTNIYTVWDAQDGTAVQVLDGVPLVPGHTVDQTRRKDLRVDTTQFERTPYVFAQKTLQLTRDPMTQLSFAGDSAGRAPWSVDNFILIESFVAGRLFARVYIGVADPIFDVANTRISRIGPEGFDFAPLAITITELVPAATETVLRISAVDYGGDAGISPLFLIAGAGA